MTEKPRDRHGEQLDTEKGAIAWVGDLLVKFGVPIGVFGYMALRAHLNRLGIPSTESLGIERYLAETFLLITNLLLPLVVVITVIASLFAISEMFARRRNRLSDLFERHPTLAGRLLSATLVGAYLVLLRRMTMLWPDQDIAVDRLVITRLEPPSGVTTLIWLLFICASAATLIPRLTTILKGWRAGQRSVASFLATFLLIVLALHIPLVYGQSVRQAGYRRVWLKLGEPSDEVCGLLVLETSADLRIWRASQGFGSIVRIPYRRVQQIESGPVIDLIREAHDAVKYLAKRAPLCQ